MDIGRKIVVGEFVRKNGQVNIGIPLKLFRDVKCVFVELAPAGGKRCDQADFHEIPPSE
jgi:hypothetical protein